jgi:predicted Zn-dependent protease
MRLMLNCIVTLTLISCVALKTAGQTPRRFADVQNIGNRTISGDDTRLSDVFPIEKEISMGAKIAADFDKSVRQISDPVVLDLINGIGQNLAKHSDADMPCFFKVIDSTEMDVLAFAGGHIYITKALITTAGNEAELAGAIAHGISHVAARHTFRLVDTELFRQVESVSIFLFWPWSNPDATTLHLSTDIEGIAPTRREFEEEADQLAVQYLWNTGYDPNAYVTLLKKLLEHEKESSSIQPHRLLPFMPATEDRIRASAHEGSQLPQKETYTVTTSEFERVKENLLLIKNTQNGKNIAEFPGQNRPSMKRKKVE